MPTSNTKKPVADANRKGQTTSARSAAALPAQGTELLSSRRVVRALDHLNAQKLTDETVLWNSRIHAVTRFHLELVQAKQHISEISQLLAVRRLPPHLFGRLVQPNGSHAAFLQLTAVISTQPASTAISNKDGEFDLALPSHVKFPVAGLTLQVAGSNTTLTLTLYKNAVSANGLTGDLRLPTELEPLPLSIVGQLQALLPSAGGAPDHGDSDAEQPTTPHVAMGEAGCHSLYLSNTGVDRFPYSVFIRLVEPRTSILNPVVVQKDPKYARRFYPIPDYFPLSEDHHGAQVTYVDRVPVDQPISVDGFRDQLVGVGSGNKISPWESVAMAGTLGLGYLVHMAQWWTPKGLTLGDLVYSLPLAPGEQQRVAIFERRDMSAVRDIESLSLQESAEFEQETDASTESTFRSAFREAERAGSRYHTSSASGGGGLDLGIISFGGGGSSSSGSSSSWLEGQRSYSSRAAETVHTSVERTAAARRQAIRTSMRLAMASESANVTTKVITNHNHTRALTLQYWEVQRLFQVSTTVEGITLVCLVPLSVVRFLPVGQPLTLDYTTSADTRQGILIRYSQILKHIDILERTLPRRFQNGLALLRQFAGDPIAQFQPAGSAAEDVIQLNLTGTFLPFEDIYVRAVTKRGTRLGPVQLTGPVSAVPEVWGDPEQSFPTQDALMAYLRDRRANNASTLSGSLAIPCSLARNEIVGFEVSRRFRQLDYDLVNPHLQAVYVLNKIFGTPLPANPPDHMIAGTVHLTAKTLEQELGGPFVWHFSARIRAVNGVSEETYAHNYISAASRQELPPDQMPIPAIQLAPVLRYSQLLEIEQMVQHVVRNTVHYSKMIWLSMTPEERAIMLEGFTIGVPAGGIEDETQDVPLLNCVENRVLGFYGNSMIMPFFIPYQVADQVLNNATIQSNLLEFHKSGFLPRKSVIALPTSGVLGEAVLGNCPSAEKIDLTRFWHWADSPADSAPEIASVQVPTTGASLTAGLQTSSALTSLQPLINNINANPTAAGADAAVLQAMVRTAAEQKGFDTGMTGAEQLAKIILGDQQNADRARADAVKNTHQFQAQALATAGNILGGLYAGNPTAGSTAANAVYGTKSESAAKTGAGSTGNSTSGTEDKTPKESDQKKKSDSE